MTKNVDSTIVVQVKNYQSKTRFFCAVDGKSASTTTFLESSLCKEIAESPKLRCQAPRGVQSNYEWYIQIFTLNEICLPGVIDCLDDKHGVIFLLRHKTMVQLGLAECISEG